MKNLEELAGSPSLYFLLGEHSYGTPQAYTGHSDDFLMRVIDHNQKKDFLEDNKQTPKEQKLQRHAKDTLQDFFTDVKFIAEFLNYPLFKAQESTVGIEYFYTNARQCKAKGFYDENGFTILAGSIIMPTETPSFSWSEKRQQLLASLVDKTTSDWVLTMDHTFGSPSMAAEFCIGRSENGWQAWKNAEGQTLDEIYRK